LADVLSGRLFAVWAPDTTRERLDTADQIIDLATRSGDTRRVLDGRLWRLIALLEFGRVAEAEVELTRYERAAEEAAQPELLFFARSRRATIAAMRGQFDDSERLARAAHDLAVRAGLPDALDVLAGQLDLIATLRGGDLVHEALDLYAAAGTPHLALSLMLAAGRDDEVRAMLPPGREFDHRLIPGPAFLGNLRIIAEVAYRFADSRPAQFVVDNVAPYSDRLIVGAGAVSCYGSVAQLLGICHASMDRPEDAVRWLRQAVTENRRAGATPFVAKSQVTLAVALRCRTAPGDTEEADRLQQEAAETATRLGMEPLLAEISQLMPKSPQDQAGRARLQRDGEDWLLAFNGRTTQLRHSKGLAQLATLLANPGREVSAAELTGSVATSSRTTVLDDTAKRAYRHRLTALDESIQIADAAGDARAGQHLAVERAALLDELKRATGIGGRSRELSNDAERARVNATRTIRQALQRVLVIDPDAGRHLMTTVRTGTRCVYQPER
jgi:hypothetical protein